MNHREMIGAIVDGVLGYRKRRLCGSKHTMSVWTTHKLDAGDVVQQAESLLHVGGEYKF